jgi:predicted lysophospholipase L1 biosynthesis ABC-type transport system permease subunit
VGLAPLIRKNRSTNRSKLRSKKGQATDERQRAIRYSAGHQRSFQTSSLFVVRRGAPVQRAVLRAIEGRFPVQGSLARRLRTEEQVHPRAMASRLPGAGSVSVMSPLPRLPSTPALV